jgi:hypothetical protein
VQPFPVQLQSALLPVVELYSGGFSKAEIKTGRYIQKRIIDFGLLSWRKLEDVIRPIRGSIVLELALFLAQKEDDDGSEISDGRTTADPDLAGIGQRIQKPVCQDNLATIRGQRKIGSLHQQLKQISQFSLFPLAGSDREQ